MLTSEHGAAPVRYNPLNYIVEEARHENIATLPNNDEQLLRWYPPANSWELLASADEARNFIRQKQRHLESLSALGRIAIPAHSDFIGANPAGSGDVVVYSLVDRVPNLQPLIKQAEIRQVHTALLKYFAWAIGTDEPAFVLDFFKLDQFHTNPHAINGEPSITMVDIDPYLVDNNTAHQARAREGLREIKLIADVAPI